MRVVEIRATPGSPAVVYRDDPVCMMLLGDGTACRRLATVGSYIRSTGGRSTELIYHCPLHAALWSDDEYHVPSEFDGWFDEPTAPRAP